MYRYICEYCKSHLDLSVTACHNCGAPVPYIHPATNLHNNPRFVQDWTFLTSSSSYPDLTKEELHLIEEARRAQERKGDSHENGLESSQI